MDKAKTILVVGASQARRARSVAWLAPAGYALHERAAPDEVMPFVEAERPALVMLDFDPGDGAFDALCRTLKQRFPDTFILQIARKLEAGQSPTRVSCDDDPLNGDVDAFLVDPTDRIELVTLVRSLLRLQQVEVELRNSQDRWQLAQSSAGLAILDWTIPSDDFVHSPSFLELFDLAPGERALRAPDIVARIHHDDLPGLVADFAVQSRATGTFDREFRVVHRNGAVRWIDARGRFFANGAGEPERMLALSFDVTQRKNAEHANAVLAAVVASSSDAIISVDDAGAITSWNAGAERLFGLTAMEIVGQPLAVVLSDLPEEDREAYRQRITQGETQELETRQMRADGSLVDIWVTSAPLRSSGGQIIGASLFVRDMTAHRQREDHVRFLMRELTHRSKNLLAVIQAMARQSLTKGIAPDEFVRRFSERLAGLAGSHDLLSSVQYKGVSLVDLINSQLNHFEGLFGTRIHIRGDDLTVRPEAAQNIGVALHELSTNAAKYGALSNDTGEVAITWGVSESEPRVFDMSWHESGGPPVREPTRRGFGHIVMNRIAGQAMNGRSAATFDPEGVRWTLSVPAAAAVVPTALAP